MMVLIAFGTGFAMGALAVVMFIRPDPLAPPRSPGPPPEYPMPFIGMIRSGREVEEM